jgi:hypothetical protein
MDDRLAEVFPRNPYRVVFIPIYVTLDIIGLLGLAAFSSVTLRLNGLTVPAMEKNIRVPYNLRRYRVRGASHDGFFPSVRDRTNFCTCVLAHKTLSFLLKTLPYHTGPDLTSPSRAAPSLTAP